MLTIESVKAAAKGLAAGGGPVLGFTFCGEFFSTTIDFSDDDEGSEICMAQLTKALNHELLARAAG